MMGLQKKDSCRDSFLKKWKFCPYAVNIYIPWGSMLLITDLFTVNNEVHNKSSRQNINLFSPRISLTKVQKGAYNWGIKICNHLPKELKQLYSDQKSFVPTWKRSLFVNSFYSAEEYFNDKC
jgi:hypothetical protein